MPYIGKTPSQATRARYYLTASGGETSISGSMTVGGTLTFTDGNFVDVSVNGVALVAGTDYNTNTANTISGLSALTASDQVEIIVYDTFSVFSGDVDSDFSVGGNLSVTGSSTLTGAVTASGGATLSSSSSGEFNALTISQADNTSGNESRIRFKRTTDAGSDREVAAIVADRVGGNDTALVFETNTDGSDGATERVRITQDGEVAIGTSTAVGTLTTECTAGDSNFALTAYHPTSTSARNIAKFQSNVGSTQADVVTIGCDGGIEAVGEITTTNSLSQNSNSIRTAIGNDGGSATFGTSTNHQIRLFTNNTEQGLLDTSGRFLINRTSVSSVNPHSKLHVLADSAVSAATIQIGTNGYAGISFLNASGSDVGSIVINASSTAYNTSSDYRLKQDVQDMTGAIDRVKTLAPKRFQFTAEPNTTVDGFLAHEAQAVVPEAVTGTHNETRTITNAILSSDGKLITEDVTEEDWTSGKKATEDANGNTVDALYPSDSTWSAKHTEPVMQAIDQAKLVPLLTGALQEAIAKIESLEARVTALEG